MNGCTVINAFDARPRFEAEMMRRLDANITAFFYRTGAGEWLGLRMEIIGAAMLVLTSLILVLSRDRCARLLAVRLCRPAWPMRSREKDSTTYRKWVRGRSIRAGQAGLVLSYGLTLSGSLYYVVYNVLMIETSMVAAERLQSYTSLPTETQAAQDEGQHTVQGGGRWPEHGAIQFHNVSVRYRADLPQVLRGVSLSIAAQERVGVVGRTGSGKSTLVVGVLFRLVEPNHGHVAIDGVSTAGMSLSVRCCPSLRINVLANSEACDTETVGTRRRFRCHNICEPGFKSSHPSPGR